MPTTTSWATWLSAKLAEHDLTPAEFIRLTSPRLDSGLVSRWLAGDITPQLPAIRIACRALKVPAVEGMIAAGRLEPGDVGVTLIRQRPRAGDLSARELGEEVTRRLYVAESVETKGSESGDLHPKNADHPQRSLGHEGEAWAARRGKPDDRDNSR